MLVPSSPQTATPSWDASHIAYHGSLHMTTGHAEKLFTQRQIHKLINRIRINDGRSKGNHTLLCLFVTRGTKMASNYWGIEKSIMFRHCISTILLSRLTPYAD